MMDNIKDYKAQPPRVIGSTTINHGLRFKMQLSPMEYILMDIIVRLVEKKKPVTDLEVFIQTGLGPDEQTLALEKLIDKGFIFPAPKADGAPHISNKWYSFFASIEEEFNQFWQKDGKNCWPGSKPKAFDLFKELRKKYGLNYLIRQRDEYFRFLELVQQSGFNRSKMMATVFLGKQERYLENWTEYANEQSKRNKKEEEIPEPIKSSTLTKEERLKKYEDTND